MRVRFERDFDFRPAALKGLVSVADKAGMEVAVPRECAEAAVAAGAGVVVKRKAKA